MLLSCSRRRTMGLGFALVICTPEPPWMWYIQISNVLMPKPALETRTNWLSGVQLGDANSELGSLETCFGSLPSGFMIQTFSLPSRSDRKAIHLPSGENLGWLSKAMPPSISLAWPPSMGTV